MTNDLRIADAPLLVDVSGEEKLPTGGYGNYSTTINQIADFTQLKWKLATEGYVNNEISVVTNKLNNHTQDKTNPHGVTKEQVGLGEVDNTADLDKPVSAYQQSAIDEKIARTSIVDNLTTDESTKVLSAKQGKTLQDTKASKTEVSESLSLKVDKSYMEDLVITANGNITNYKTEVELLAFIPTTMNYTAKALDTKKVWLWDGKWNDTGLSELDLAKEIINNPEVIFTSSISVDSNGVVTFPIFYGAKAGKALKKYDATYTFTPEQYGYFYALYYNFETHTISSTTATIRNASADECLVGIAYSGRFASKYAVKYKGETNVIPKLSNEILNGSLNIALPIDTLYAYTNQSSTDYAPIVSVSDDMLKSLGIRNAQKLEASAKRGGFGQAQLFNRKLRSLKCTIAVIVYDPTATFNFGTTGGITAYFQKLNADGTASANFLTANLTAFQQISENVRLYTYSSATVSLSQTTYPDSYISNILIGGRVGTDAPNPIYISGYWFSQTDDLKGYKYPIALSDTHYPQYLNVSSASIYDYFSAKATTNSANIASIDTRVKALETFVEPKTSLASLYDDLHNPLMSVNIKLVGDSITWGSGASNRSAFDPRTGRLSDPRNKIDPVSPSWANLLRQWLCATYTDGTLTDEGTGSGYAESTNIILLSKDTDYFKFSNPTRSLSFSSNAVRALIGVSASLNSREYLDIVPPSYTANYPSEFSFTMNGSGFSVVFAKFANGDADSYFFNVYIDDVFYKKVSLYAEVASFNHEEFIELPNNGKHKITIKNESTVNNVLRLQNLSVVKTVRVANDGINGATTYSWLNAVKLSESIKSKDDYVFVQLGTNDRITGTNQSLTYFSQNMRKIVDDIYTLSSNNAKVILMSANAVTKDESSESVYYCTMKTINSAVKQVADEKKVSFISNYEATQQLKIDGTAYTDDGTHPNDLGYRAIFENIKNHILKK